MLLLVATAAAAHPKGFHKKAIITLTHTRVSALVVMDVDSGDRCLLLREAVDSNRNGKIEGEEVAKLKERLVKMATSTLVLGLSGAPLKLTIKDTKLNLREDPRANDSPLSVAVLLELDHKDAVSSGMKLEFTDTSPDQSTVVLQVFQEGMAGAPFEAEVKSGVKTLVPIEL
ncbi:MAG: hypothetical protein QM817_04945 [Archangium sp.]